jgi:hypothetical protein
MRRALFVVLFAVLSLGFVRAQRQPYRVVFDLTSRDSLEQKAVLRWLKEVGTSRLCASSGGGAVSLVNSDSATICRDQQTDACDH